jgi:two-component system response regulator TctD
MRILLVEDDEQLVETTARALRSQGWVVDCSAPARRVRAEGLTVPVLILTARDAVEDRVRGLEGGADDYLVKPFALTELVARARALVRRSQARTSNQLQLARLRVDQEARRAYIDDEPLALSAREWDVLGFLMARAGKVVAKEHIALASNAWDQGVSDNAIEVCLSRLRAKIEPGGVQLRTVRGLGYLLEEMPTAHG